MINDTKSNCLIKGKLDPNLYQVFKSILEKLKITQQEFVETKVKEFVLENVNLIIIGDKK